ncbi:MAG: acyl carrier protein [Vicinamibacteria bacterium]
MDARGIRQVLIDGLEAGGVSEARSIRFREPFLDGSIDATFEELALDSLARMEVCIAIEVALGISLAPEELQRYASLGELANDLRERLSG